MSASRDIARLFVAGIMMCAIGTICAQGFPTRPIRIVTTSAGSNNDLVARLLAQGLSAGLGQQVIVDNRGGGTLPIELVVRAAPDGYNLLLNGSTLWLLPYMRDNVPWDPLRDFSPITLAASSPAILVVHPSLAVKSVKDLIVLARARPGQLNYGSGGSGSATHLSAELFKAMAGVNIVGILYKGIAPALTSLVAGEVQVSFATSASALPLVNAGKLRALAVTSAQPFPLYPNLATVAASGLPGYESATISGILAPAGTPAAIIELLNREIVQVLNRPDVKERLTNAGAIVVGGSPDQLSGAMKSEMSRMGKIIIAAGIRD
jgi:tripartite-type tricarboxylate transporter receptor subunit TctC